MPTTQAKRQALLLSLKNYFAANPAYEVNTPKLVGTSALAGTLFDVSPARKPMLEVACSCVEK